MEGVKTYKIAIKDDDNVHHSLFDREMVAATLFDEMIGLPST